MIYNRPKNIDDLFYLQSVLDENISKTRNNDFTPREKVEHDILYAMDDEIQEWLRELPFEINFKVWKQKEYNREKELEELTDVLFFILQLGNYNSYLKKFFKSDFEKWETVVTVTERFEESFKDIEIRDFLVDDLKLNLGTLYHHFLLRSFIAICKWRRFTKDDIITQYWIKWHSNIGERINGDWILQK